MALYSGAAGGLCCGLFDRRPSRVYHTERASIVVYNTMCVTLTVGDLAVLRAAGGVRRGLLEDPGSHPAPGEDHGRPSEKKRGR